MAAKYPVHPDVLTLADLLRAEWPAARQRIRLSGHPTCEDDDSGGDDAGAGDADKGKGKAGDKAGDDAGDDDDGDDAGDDAGDDGKAGTDTDWKKMARRHERAAKVARADREALAAKLREREDADKSEQQKAIDKAREEATAEVTTKYEAQQRADRIENAITRLSLKGFKGKIDGKDVTLRFADPDDAQLRLDRALRNDEIAYDDIYAEGKVQSDAIITFLTELLEEHPRLRAPEGNGNAGKDDRVDFDGGKGKDGGGKTLSDMTPDDHLKAIQGNRR